MAHVGEIKDLCSNPVFKKKGIIFIKTYVHFSLNLNAMLANKGYIHTAVSEKKKQINDQHLPTQYMEVKVTVG